ncbi:MAG: FAD-dependent oxidoreductase [Bacteroidaceae bacterium]|nr:FAD-dependent oxidoreductase [Bacteroidaceae bacterium]
MNHNIVIIGGGIAGMEAAKALLALGHTPILIESKPYLGGHVAKWHKLFPDMSSATELVEKLRKDITAANIFLSTDVISMNRLASGWTLKLSNGIVINASAILVSTGFKLFEASKKEEYGYGVYENVITNSDLEAWFNGESDWRIPQNPKTIGFVHCVGSRDLKACNGQCSKVCCATAIKQAIEIKERFPFAKVYCFYMDLRLFGKKYEDFYVNAQRDYGVQFIRGRVSEVGETIDHRLQVKAEDTLSGKPLKLQLDMLVLMAGIVNNPSIRSISAMSGLETDSDGFLRSSDNEYGVVESGQPGIYFAGACTGPKTVPETVAEARSAALQIHSYIKKLA